MTSHQEFRDPALSMAVRIPSPPPLLDKLNRLLETPNARMESIAQAIQSDAGLTASLFRTLSRPAYGLRRPPETVAQAISLVGLKTLADLTKAVSLEAVLFGESKFYPWFWERANDIARYAAAIAWRQRSVCNVFPEHAQLAALFQDCGVPILIQHIEKYEYAFITAEAYVWPNVLKEDARFDTDHAVVGYLAARHWKLPAYVCESVRWHHEPVNVEDKAATLIAILQTATHLYNIHAMKDDSDWPARAADALEEIGVGMEGVKEFEEEIYDRARGN
jgi:HD-like signal output (HDOD) protein